MPVLSEPAGEKASFSMPEQKRRPVNPKLTNTTSIVERDLFDPEQGARSVKKTKPFPKVKDIVLLGTFIAGSQRYAIVEVPPEEGPRAGRGKRLLRGKRLTRGEQLRLALGDTLDGFKIVEIHSQRVVFKRGSSTLEAVLDFSRKIEEVKEKVPKKARQVAKARTPRRPERSLEVEDEED